MYRKKRWILSWKRRIFVGVTVRYVALASEVCVWLMGEREGGRGVKGHTRVVRIR